MTLPRKHADRVVHLAEPYASLDHTFNSPHNLTRLCSLIRTTTNVIVLSDAFRAYRPLAMLYASEGFCPCCFAKDCQPKLNLDNDKYYYQWQICVICSLHWRLSSELGEMLMLMLRDPLLRDRVVTYSDPMPIAATLLDRH